MWQDFAVKDLARSGLAITDMNAEEAKGAFGVVDGYLIPYYDRHGNRRKEMWRVRCASGPQKYMQPKRAEMNGGDAAPPYFHPHCDYSLSGKIKLMTEGEKKNAAAYKFLQNIQPVGIGGCWNWQDPASAGGPTRLHPELIDFFKGSKEILYIPDADFRTNEQVERALGSLRLACKVAGFTLKIVTLPKDFKGGLDDWLMSLPPGSHDAAFWALEQTDGKSLLTRPRDTWDAIGLPINGEGKPVMLEYCLVDALARWDYLADSYYYDIRSSRHYLRLNGHFKPVDDIAIEYLKRHLQRALGLGKISGELMGAILHGLAMHFPRNPLAEHLQSLRWDRKPRFDTLVTKLGVDPAKQSYAMHVLRNLVTGACARSLTPGTKYDHCVILEGPQGFGKSVFWKELATLNGECYYAVASISAYSHVIGTRDFLTAGARSIFYDLDELAVLSKSDVNAVKTMLSTTMDTYRPSYGRCDIEVQRSFLCVGTTNSDAYLIDPTGNRRFLPISVGEDGNKHFDMTWLINNREQLWAEAMDSYLSGHKFWELPAAEQKQAEEEQEQRNVEDGYSDPIARYLSRAYATSPVDRPLVVSYHNRDYYCYTNTQIYDHLEVPHDKRQGLNRRIGALVKAMGPWQRQTVRVAGQTTRAFITDKEVADKQPRQDNNIPKF